MPCLLFRGPIDKGDCSVNTVKNLRLLAGTIEKGIRTKLILFSIAISVSSLLDILGLALISATTNVGFAVVGKSSITSSTSWILRTLGIQSFLQKDQISVLLVSAVLLFFAKSLFGIFLSKSILQEVGDLQVSITERLLQRMFASPMVRVLNEKREEILHGLTDGLNSICVGIIGPSILVLGEIITLLGIIGFLFVVNFAMATGVILYFVFLSFIVTRITGRWLTGPSSQMTTSSIESRQNLRDILSLFREITLFQKRDSFAQEFVGHRSRAIDSYVRVNWIQQLPKYILESSVIIGALGIVTVYSRLSGISSAVSNLIIFMVASSRLVPSVLRLQSFLLQVRSSEKSANYSFTLMNSLNYFDEPSMAEEISEQENRTGTHPLAIEAKDLSFRYPGANTDAISAVSLRIEPGEFVALVGPSGSGKSTLADVFLGFLQPSEGKVAISESQVNPLAASVTPRLAYMPQKVHVFSGSLLENIVLDRNVSEAEAKLAEIAAVRAGLGDWLHGQETGIHTLLSETNSPLSGGERQRIGLARVFYANPDLLILDEPTSSLDTGTEDHVMENVLKLRGECTIIVIAHRLSTIQEVDRVIRINEGKVEWEGSYVELLE